MQWFTGSVSEAIAESKRTRSAFVVYMKDEGEESKKMDEILSNEQISSVCSRDCTALRLDVNSVEGKQFASIYPVLCVPCVYFIDGNGVPAEVIGGSLPVEQFLEKATQAIQNHRIKFPKSQPESLQSTSSLPSASPSPSASSSLNASSSQTVPFQGGFSDGERNEPSTELAERVARAKKLVEEKRKEKQEKEKEDAQRKEIERRKQGQQLAKAKTEREERLAQQMAERVRLEKAKEKAAREAIREKIAQDKAERAARQEMERMERRNVAARIDPQLSANNPTVECSDVRLQFRLPDGSSITQNFPSDEVLETARLFICSKTNSSKRISFWTMFPRRHFVEEDFSKSLDDLGLSPSAALVVDSSSANTSTYFDDSKGLSFSSVLTWLLAPFLALLSFLKLLLFASPQQSSGAVQGNSRQLTSGANQSSSSSPNSEIRRRTKESGKNEETFKKEGKIHSFRQDDNGDDENNTWNGNSTQQM